MKNQKKTLLISRKMQNARKKRRFRENLRYLVNEKFVIYLIYRNLIYREKLSDKLCLIHRL